MAFPIQRCVIAAWSIARRASWPGLIWCIQSKGKTQSFGDEGLPEVVPKDDLLAASALNNIGVDFPRAVGPWLAGFIVAAAGAGSACMLNAVSFFCFIAVKAGWKRAIHKSTSPPDLIPLGRRAWHPGHSTPNCQEVEAVHCLDDRGPRLTECGVPRRAACGKGWTAEAEFNRTRQVIFNMQL